MNNKGFMMAEVIVVSAVILVTLVGLYASYNKIFVIYNQRINYYDINTLYELSNIRDNYLYPSEVNTKKVDGVNTIYYVNKYLVKNKTVDTTGLNQTFKDYLDYLSTSLDFDNFVAGEWNVQNMLIMEKCNVDNSDCKYAYLEVVDDDAVEVAPEEPSSSSSSSKPSSSSSSKPSSSSSSKPSSSSSSKPSSSSSSSSSSTIGGTVGLCGSCSVNKDCAVGTCSGTCVGNGKSYKCCVSGGNQCN